MTTFYIIKQQVERISPGFRERTPNVFIKRAAKKRIITL